MKMITLTISGYTYGSALVMTKPFSTVWIRTAPNTVPTTPPRPPNSEVPPSTAAAITGNSF